VDWLFLLLAEAADYSRRDVVILLVVVLSADIFNFDPLKTGAGVEKEKLHSICISSND
jgi:hypothetical protein